MGFVADAVGGVVGGLLSKSGKKKQARDIEQATALAASQVAPFKDAGVSANNLISSALGVPGFGGGTATTISPTSGTGSGPSPEQIQQLIPQILQAGGPAAQEMQALIDQGANPVSAFMGVMQGGGPGASEIMQFMGGSGGGGGTGGSGGADNAFARFMDSTGTRFAMDQGMTAITGNKAAKGLLNSGSTLKALNQFGQGLAQQRFSNWLANLEGVANRGANAANTTANVVGQGTTAAANARQQGREGFQAGLGQAFEAGTNFLGDIFA